MLTRKTLKWSTSLVRPRGSSHEQTSLSGDPLLLSELSGCDGFSSEQHACDDELDSGVDPKQQQKGLAKANTKMIATICFKIAIVVLLRELARSIYSSNFW